MKKSYEELISIPTFQERYEYLKMIEEIGAETFGYDRYLNQQLYRSPEWKEIRRRVLIRDNGCDLAMPGYLIGYRPIIHHINPITIEQIENRDPALFDLENLVLTCIDTHNAIHYGEVRDFSGPIERKPNDTCPWR